MSRSRIRAQIEALASKIAEQALSDTSDMAYENRLDTFKALTAWYVGVGRLAAKTGEDDGEEGATIDEFRKRIAAAADLGGPGDSEPADRAGNGGGEA